MNRVKERNLQMAKEVFIFSKGNKFEITIDGNKINGVTAYKVAELAEKPVEVTISFSVTESLEVLL